MQIALAVYPLPEMVYARSIWGWEFSELWNVSTYIIIYHVDKTYILTQNPIIFHTYVKHKDGR